MSMAYKKSVQQVPDGYKQTDVGVIPDDWLVEPLENFTSFISYGFTNPMPTSTAGPFMVTAKDVNFGRVLFESARQTTREAYRSLLSPKSRPKLNDILLTKDGTLGRLALVDKEGICINQSVALLRLNARIDPLYLKKLLESPRYQKKMIEDAGGSTIKHIYITIVNRMAVNVPSSKEEQAAIANALSDVDALITSLEKLIAKKRAIKTAAMQQLLTGKTRLPPFDQSHTGYKQTELGKIPEDWEVVELSNIGKNLIGLTYSPNDVVEYGTLVLRSSNVQKNKLAFKNNVFVDMELPSRVIVKEGDILICVRNGSKQLIGKCALIDKRTAGVAFGAFMSIYRTEFSSFIFYQFQSNIIQRQIDEIMGATINQITNKDMATFKVPLPNDADEQIAITNALSDMTVEIDALNQRLAKTQQIKQGMMQELLTGRTRLV